MARVSVSQRKSGVHIHVMSGGQCTLAWSVYQAMYVDFSMPVGILVNQTTPFPITELRGVVWFTRLARGLYRLSCPTSMVRLYSWCKKKSKASTTSYMIEATERACMYQTCVCVCVCVCGLASQPFLPRKGLVHGVTTACLIGVEMKLLNVTSLTTRSAFTWRSL